MAPSPPQPRLPQGAAKEAHLAEAAALLAERGPADRGFRLRGAQTAAAAGLSRAGLYRMWTSLDALSDDILRYGITDHPDWRRTLLGERGPSLGATVATASLVDPAFVALACRTLALSVPAGDVRGLAASDDAAWTTTFGAWLDALLRAEGRRTVSGLSPSDLALVLTALIEGTITQASMTAGIDRDFWTTRESADLAGVVDRAWARMTVPGVMPADGLEAPAPAAAAQRWTPRQRAVIEAVCRRHIELPFDHPDAPLTVRLVDPAALARRLGITERRLRQIWPSIAELNADLFSRQVGLLRAETEALATAVLLEKLGDATEVTVDVLIEVIQAVIGAGIDGQAAGLFAIAFAVSEPVLSARAAQEFVDWRHSQQILFYGLLNAFGTSPPADISIAPYTRAIFSILIGSMRLALLNPSVLDRRVGDQATPLLGLGVSLVLSGLVAPDARAPRPDGTGAP